MNTKRMPVALLVVATIVTVVVPGRIYAQTGRIQSGCPPTRTRGFSSSGGV